ncbi:MAG: hypothetical protein WCY02_03435, partial [Parvibaculum sp.]
DQCTQFALLRLNPTFLEMFHDLSVSAGLARASQRHPITARPIDVRNMMVEDRSPICAAPFCSYVSINCYIQMR